MQLLDKQALRSLLPDEDRLRFDDIPPHYLTDALDRCSATRFLRNSDRIIEKK